MILWRHILRAHAGPFVFANAIVIFLFLLQFLMKTAGDLVGKGLSTPVIIELVVLNLAWMLVLAVPMSVLVSTVMAFGKMSADNETTIMRASGMSLYRMMVPVVLAVGAVTYGLIEFNNRVLPEANIRLRTLMTDIVRIKPTLSLQAGVFTAENDLPDYRILVRRTFEKSNDLEGVTIYDLSRAEKNVVVTAERGKVSFSRDYSRIYMDLDQGEIHELTLDKMQSYRRLRFTRHRVSIPASGFGFQRSDAATAQRDDRTMSAGMMRGIVDSLRALQAVRSGAMRQRLRTHLAAFQRGVPELFAPAPGAPSVARVPVDQRSARRTADRGRNVPPLPAPESPRGSDAHDACLRAMTDARQLQSFLLADASSIEYTQGQIDKFLVEIYKKYSIPAACLVFAFIGVPLGLMARRGGLGVGAGLSLGFFLFYWACLIGGEKLADRDVLSPFFGMWIANIVLGICGAALTLRAARETTAIDWSRFSLILPKSWRVEPSPPQNQRGRE